MNQAVDPRSYHLERDRASGRDSTCRRRRIKGRGEGGGGALPLFLRLRQRSSKRRISSAAFFLSPLRFATKERERERERSRGSAGLKKRIRDTFRRRSDAGGTNWLTMKRYQPSDPRAPLVHADAEAPAFGKYASFPKPCPTLNALTLISRARHVS